MITYTGLKNGRPTFKQSEAEEARNKGILPRWLIKKMDTKQIKLVGGELVVDGRAIKVGEVVSQ